MFQIALWTLHVGRALADPRKGCPSGPGSGRTPFWEQILTKTLIKPAPNGILGGSTWVAPLAPPWPDPEVIFCTGDFLYVQKTASYAIDHQY